MSTSATRIRRLSMCIRVGSAFKCAIASTMLSAISTTERSIGPLSNSTTIRPLLGLAMFVLFLGQLQPDNPILGVLVRTYPIYQLPMLGVRIGELYTYSEQLGHCRHVLPVQLTP